MYCVLTEHLAECERFKYFQSAKWSKVKIKSVPSSFSGLPFLYLPNVLIHELNEFIHVRVEDSIGTYVENKLRTNVIALTSKALELLLLISQTLTAVICVHNRHWVLSGKLSLCLIFSL